VGTSTTWYNRSELLRAVAGWEERGYRVKLGEHIWDRDDYQAGDPKHRAADMNAMFADPEVDLVHPFQGGYTAAQMLPHLDYDLIAANPKALVGFSDITALQFALWRGARLATVHGPGVAWLDERTPPHSAESLRAALMTDRPVTLSPVATEETSGVRVPGVAEGPLLGGNLCLITSSIGTRDMPDLAGAVLLIEEVGEPPYKVDRMLTHLRRAGVLDAVAGVAVGQFTDCADDWAVDVADVIAERLGDLGVPVLGGLPIGHGTGQLTVPVGTSATLDADAGVLNVSPAVT
jgi:muramoyltetrapeptide carboxypeptidase